MKKSLFAIAAVTAFAGAAQAQSSVTVYGILDMGFVGHSQRLASNAGVVKNTGNSFTNGAESTTRLGFRGTEDMGGGLSAFFTVEVALTPNDQQAISSASTSNRQTFVGLKKNGIGNFALGTQYTPIHTAVAVTSANQQNNIMGDVIYPSNTINGATGGGASNGSNAGYTVRTANMLKLTTDNFAGLVATGFITANNKNSTEGDAALANGYSGGNDNRSGWGIGANYTFKKFMATANYQALTAKNPYSATNAQLAAGTATTGAPAIFGTAVQTGTNIKDNQYYVAATYDFGILKAYAQYINRKATVEFNTSAYTTRTAQQIGVRSFITPKIEGWASGGTGRYRANGVSEPTVNFNGWQLGSNYWLSKRTNLYAIYGQTGTSSASGNNNSYNGSNYALGVRHTF